jgi:hypothetical protein
MINRTPANRGTTGLSNAYILGITYHTETQGSTERNTRSMHAGTACSGHLGPPDNSTTVVL